MQHVDKKELQAYFSEFVSDNKRSLIEQILLERTHHITVVLEDIFQSQNASAVIRSCDCFGIQKVHVVEDRYPFNQNRDVTLGSAQWVDIDYYKDPSNSMKMCAEQLRKEGYKLVATAPHANGIEIEELQVNDKIALMFGTEIDGLSEEAMDLADIHVRIPTVGFTESLNLSVCAAIFLFSLTQKLRSGSIDYHLSEDEKLDLRIKWMKQIVKKGNLLEKEFFNRRAKKT